MNVAMTFSVPQKRQSVDRVLLYLNQFWTDLENVLRGDVTQIDITWCYLLATPLNIT